MRLLPSTIYCSLIILTCALGFGESTLVAPTNYHQTFYVTPNGTTTADGLTEQNGVTLQRALYLARGEINEGPIRILITKGIHRSGNKGVSEHLDQFLASADFSEDNTLPRYPGDTQQIATTPPNILAIEGEGNDPSKVVVSGSEILTGPWIAEGDVFYTTWEHNFGELDLANSSEWFEDIGTERVKRFNRRELIFVDGARLRQVFTQQDLVVGTFYVDEGADRLYVYPPPNTDLSQALVESGFYKYLLDIRRKNNLIIRGITFRHAAGWYSDGGNTSGACIYLGGWGPYEPSNLLVEDVIVEWNGASGLHGYGREFTYRNIIHRHNGMMGLGLSGNQGLIVDCENYGNNWKGAESQYFQDVVSGVKAGNLYNTEFLRFNSSYNYGKGLWLDVYCRDIEIRDSTLSYNQHGEGIFFEIFQGNGLVENSTIEYNGSFGVLGVQAESVTLRNNVIRGNAVAQINASTGTPREATVTDKPTNTTYSATELRTRNWIVEDNEFAIEHERQSFWFTGGSETWDGFRNSLQASGNTYYGFSTAAFLKNETSGARGSLDQWHHWEPEAQLLDRSAGLPAPSSSTNAALYQIWQDNSGDGDAGRHARALGMVDTVDNRPSAQFPLPQFATISNFSNNYIQRLRAYVTIPEDGIYHFWITGNAETALQINTSGQKSPLTTIASVVEPADHPSEYQVYEYDHSSSQTAGIPLVAGQVIYLEALANQGSTRTDLGGSVPHISVSWSRPPGSSTITYHHAREVIPAQYLSYTGLDTPVSAEPTSGVVREYFNGFDFSSPNAPIHDLLRVC